ncbi:adenylosuccinate lyase [Campylobacter sp.]|uniref:adenylosuccinate lyase n=1 Tax=Campylobacter sp. TaxID=205 RepID=UPI0026DB0F8D|nr:adenylosuccinate lyase [Campylobacter sp.]MDO4674513.1 adenylosuccinate lyase [Campylobacter sp.]
MRIVQSLETINVNTDDISLFCYLKDLITKNFSKVVGRKNKIFSFFEESEIPQRRYFLKLLDKKYCQFSNEGIENLKEAHFKTFRLNFEQGNALKPMLSIEIDFGGKNIFMRLSSNEKLFVSYMRNYFKEHFDSYDEGTFIFALKYQNESTFELFELFASESEHLRYCVDFKINSKDYKEWRQGIHSRENVRWKFDALAKLFGNYFSTLECTPQNDLSEIRQKYLVLVKLYHPDFQYNKSSIERAYCREQFEKIQIAYDNLKALYRNNT